MNFKGHLAAGAVAGVVVAESASRLGFVPQEDYPVWGAVWATTFFFSLFPDLDTSSVPQRWFFRIVFGLLIYLGWTEHYELATLIGLLSIIPLLDHHRGWTHRKISPLIVPIALVATYSYWRARNTWLGEFSWTNVWDLLEANLVFWAASLIGWYIHLILDGYFRVFPTAGDHH